MTLKTILLISLVAAVVALAITLVWIRARRRLREAEAETFEPGDWIYLLDENGQGQFYRIDNVAKGPELRIEKSR